MYEPTERTVYQAFVLGKLKKTKNNKKNKKDGVQASINRLAKTEEFRTALDLEAEERGLRPQDISSCVKLVYNELSQHAHGNNRNIVVRTKDYGTNMLAAIITILKVQKGWIGGLEWQEVEKEEEPEEE